MPIRSRHWGAAVLGLLPEVRPVCRLRVSGREALYQRGAVHVTPTPSQRHLPIPAVNRKAAAPQHPSSLHCKDTELRPRTRPHHRGSPSAWTPGNGDARGSGRLPAGCCLPLGQRVAGLCLRSRGCRASTPGARLPRPRPSLSCAPTLTMRRPASMLPASPGTGWGAGGALGPAMANGQTCTCVWPVLRTPGRHETVKKCLPRPKICCSFHLNP